MKYVLKFVLVTLCLLLFSTFLFANDPNREFSIANNPNGVWSYGFTPTLGGSFSLADTKHVNNVWPSGYQQGMDNWSSSSQVDCDNGIGGVTGRAKAQQLLLASGDAETIPWDTLAQGPGCHGEYSILRWTAPLSATYQFRGSYQGMFLTCGGSTTDVHIRWNSKNPLFDAEIYGFVDNRQAFFDLQQPVAAGTTSTSPLVGASIVTTIVTRRPCSSGLILSPPLTSTPAALTTRFTSERPARSG